MELNLQWERVKALGDGADRQFGLLGVAAESRIIDPWKTSLGFFLKVLVCSILFKLLK